MKIKIELDPAFEEEEVIIKANSVSNKIMLLQESINRAMNGADEIAVKKDDKECFININKILFAETSDNKTWIHTADDFYFCPLRLYELEQMLPRSFTKASKSCIINTKYINSIWRSPTGVGEAAFFGSDKKVFISRMYYKAIREIIEETRLKR